MNIPTVTAAEYNELLAERDRLRAELIAYQKDVEGAERRVLAFAHACVRGVEGITVGGALEAQRDEIAKLRAQRDELAEALRKLIDDMHIRAKFRGDVDPDGTVVLDCGTGVLFAAKEALAKLEGKQ